MKVKVSPPRVSSSPTYISDREKQFLQNPCDTNGLFFLNSFFQPFEFLRLSEEQKDQDQGRKAEREPSLWKSSLLDEVGRQNKPPFFGLKAIQVKYV
ncbi:hypothetical protein AKJ39_03375 [candidate division MSBL1 archaeon SCGC-AAA259J03]|uniref:Uncharacterized protein n=1 Tax=candidate division MSBL1 archaeon SCGC-AAA259J03 TaxID=1698269 RepID=A0A656YVN8_9EURY|nr:hypothetical protein AKJ39_03375 [candidate division MSBL1 archaeon SCGC-AAA259J03]